MNLEDIMKLPKVEDMSNNLDIKIEEANRQLTYNIKQENTMITLREATLALIEDYIGLTNSTASVKCLENDIKSLFKADGYGELAIEAVAVGGIINLIPKDKGAQIIWNDIMGRGVIGLQPTVIKVIRY